MAELSGLFCSPGPCGFCLSIPVVQILILAFPRHLPPNKQIQTCLSISLLPAPFACSLLGVIIKCVCMHMRMMCVSVYHLVHVEVRGQLLGVSSLLPPQEGIELRSSSIFTC